eukprot:comp19578_c0_seq1/m.23017 comp19578_c0_seq1/g.23017  ORF comp19578_c0_seq1/g.23017 comp19578_c0_seq1/m.23017 type:complete len:697 (-) comp19578_c0_seq1:129-2219(-)
MGGLTNETTGDKIGMLVTAVVVFGIPFVLYIVMLSFTSRLTKVLEDAEKNDPHAVGDGSEKQRHRDKIETQVYLSFDKITYTVKTGPKSTLEILHGVSGLFRPGRLTAIMGPSGCGKSTLLDILADRKSEGKVDGAIRINGHPRGAMFKRIAAYVMQSDCLFASLTVRETLLFAAEFRLPDEMSPSAKMRVVDDVIRSLDLGIVANTRIGDDRSGGLSGGQKRRVTVAIEMVANPSVLFLDEPTSGLDAYGSLRLVRVLRRLADKGHNVVCTIHQPRSDIFALFDDLYLMKAGRTIYAGPIKGIRDYFLEAGYEMDPTVNPADFIVDLTQKKDEEPPQEVVDEGVDTQPPDGVAMNKPESGGDRLVAFYDKSFIRTEYEEEIGSIHRLEYPGLPPPVEASGGRAESVYVSSFWKQLVTLCVRTYIANIRNGAYVSAWIVGGITYLFYGTLYVNVSIGDPTDTTNLLAIQSSYRYQSAFIYQLLAAMFFSEATMVANVFLEKEMLRRESASGTYSFLAYHTCWLLRLLFIAVIKGVLYTPLVYFLGHLPVTAHQYFMFTLYLAIMDAVGTGCALMCASATPSLESAAAAFVTINICSQNLSGFFIMPPIIPPWFKWLYYTLFFKYGLEGLYCTMWNEDVVNGHDVIPDIIYVDPTLNEWTNAIVFMMYPLFFHVFAYLATIFSNGLSPAKIWAMISR